MGSTTFRSLHRTRCEPHSSPIATSRFSEAIIDFLADEQRAAEARIRAEDFEGEAYSIYELFTSIWLQSKESKVCRGAIMVDAILW